MLLFHLLVGLSLAADPAAAPAAADEAALLGTFRDEFVLIAPGEGAFPKAFTMGGPEHAPKSQLPQHEVVIKSSFSMAKYETTQNLWQAVMGGNPSRWKGNRNAVENLSFEDAEEFCRRVTIKLRSAKLIGEKQTVRLPSEAEWEYCCRAGETTAYSFGDDAAKLDAFAWHTGNAAGNDPAVGAKKANAWGLYDMHGYLSEWCVDHWHENYAGAPTDGTAWLTKGTKQRVLRGGSWKDKAEELTCSARRAAADDLKDDAVGLRCVLAEGETFTAAPVDIVPAGSKLELLWGEGEFTEGPALAPDGSIFFSDIGDAIYRFDPATNKTELFRQPSGRANGMMFDKQGRLIVCEGANTGGGRRISITEGIVGGKDGTVLTLAEGFDGKRFNSPNDLAIDPFGNVYFSDPRYVGEEPRELDFEGVFRVTPDGNVTVAARDVEKPNGVLVSIDGEHVWVADHNHEGVRQLLQFDADGSIKPKTRRVALTNKKVLYDFGKQRGIDGMTLDSSSRIFAAAGSGETAGVHIFDGDGKKLGYIPTPGEPTNCVFGRADEMQCSWLYVTAATGQGGKFGLYRIKVATVGHNVVAPTMDPQATGQ